MTPDAPRPTSELAADVRAGLVRAFDPDAKLRLPNPDALAALSALVARITDLEAHAAGPVPTRERIRDYHSRLPAEWQGWDAVRQDHFAYYQGAEACYICTLLAAVEAVEAQVAALTQELDTLNDDAERIIGQVRERAEAAEAAVATQAEALRATRQALAEAADELRKHGSEYRDSHGDYVSERRADEVLGIARRCILAGCPTRVCRVCGKPSERIVEQAPNPYPGSSHDHTQDLAGPGAQRHASGVPAGTIMARRFYERGPNQTVGWSDCGHNNWRPGVVLDPFIGSGTTAKVARDHQRHAIGVDLNETYLELAARRLQQLSLLNDSAA